MYKIIIKHPEHPEGDRLLWAPSVSNEGYPIYDPALTFETSKPSTMTLSVPKGNKWKDVLNMLLPEIYVYDGAERIFRGRVINDEKDFKRTRKVYCESDLSYLRDVVVRHQATWRHIGVVKDVGNDKGYFHHMIDKYNGIMSEAGCGYKTFYFGGCDVDGEYATRENDQYPDVLSELTDKLLNKYGGFLYTKCVVENGDEKTYIYYMKDPAEGTQRIKYAKNLLDLTEKTDAAPVYTRIIPLGAIQNNERIKIAGLSIDSDKIADYGLIERAVNYDDITDRQQLEDKGTADLEKAENPTDSIEINAVDMSFTGETNERLSVGTTYIIQSVPHEKEDRFLLKRAEIKLNRPADNVYTFGNVNAGITQEAVSVNRAMDQVTQLSLLNNANVQELREALANIADYVVENGTQGSYFWTKWNSGKLELRASNLQRIPTNGGTWGESEFTYYYFDVALPISFIDTNYTVSAVRSSGTTFTLIGVAHNAVNSVRISVAMPTPQTDPANLYIDLTIVGKWK